jgi:hypothetical protein
MSLDIRGIFSTLEKMVKNDNLPFKNGPANFKIRGPEWRNVFAANNEGNLYCMMLSDGQLYPDEAICRC